MLACHALPMGLLRMGSWLACPCLADGPMGRWADGPMGLVSQRTVSHCAQRNQHGTWRVAPNAARNGTQGTHESHSHEAQPTLARDVTPRHATPRSTTDMARGSQHCTHARLLPCRFTGGNSAYASSGINAVDPNDPAEGDSFKEYVERAAQRNKGLVAAKSISFGSPHVRCTSMWAHSTRGEPNEISLAAINVE